MTQQNVKGAAKTAGNLHETKAPATFEEIYAFLRFHYKPSRFEERNSEKGMWVDYSTSVTQSTLDQLKKYGRTCISRHEDRAGVGFFFNANLLIE